jgi:hypothetical protein
MNKRNQLNALQELLSQLKIHDPGIRKLIEQLSNKSYKGDEQKEIIRRLRIQNKKLIQQVALLKERLLTAKEDRLKVLNNVSHIKKLNASLAEALGSCSICWGEDPSCTSCKGKASLDGERSTGVISIYMCCQGLKLYTSRKLCKAFF